MWLVLKGDNSVIISDFLFVGEENAQNSKELCNLLHVDLRALRASVERERRNGIPICATSSNEKSGYYLAGDKQEMRNYCRFLKTRKDSIQRTLAACQKTIDKLPDKRQNNRN